MGRFEPKQNNKIITEVNNMVKLTQVTKISKVQCALKRLTIFGEHWPNYFFKINFFKCEPDTMIRMIRLIH